MPDPITKAHAAVDYVHSEHRRQIREKNRQINALQAEKGELQRALQERPRTLTAANISDEMVERAWDACLDLIGTTPSKSTLRHALTAALTEPPARPEGAEELSSELEAVLAHLGIGDGHVSPEERDEAADLLAERGVRVTGKDN